MSNTNLITVDKTSQVLQEIQDAFYDIPFENSAFQTENFVIAAQITPERAYRAIGLRMNKKLIAVQEALISKEMEQLEEDELRYKISNPESTPFEVRRAELELKRMQVNRPFSDKLLNDALKELNILYKHFKALPKYTREEFEAGEERHHTEKNTRVMLGKSGSVEALENMQTDIHNITSFEEQYGLLPESKRFLLEELTESIFSADPRQNKHLISR